ncbi:hypothetical protein FOMPIDRAFT_1047807 [Fomitopsis schrenkii]|uniref:Uncharacterized protein n=1 Tax=Fomitopsis schrenkii TaxID=2126942 RepID=S8ECU0_FOMSC|nr:hypothetical protein FOMPIDRAFT_1047807 [Fomitopsis schrenkii]
MTKRARGRRNRALSYQTGAYTIQNIRRMRTYRGKEGCMGAGVVYLHNGSQWHHPPRGIVHGLCVRALACAVLGEPKSNAAPRECHRRCAATSGYPPCSPFRMSVTSPVAVGELVPIFPEGRGQSSQSGATTGGAAARNVSAAVAMSCSERVDRETVCSGWAAWLPVADVEERVAALHVDFGGAPDLALARAEREKGERDALTRPTSPVPGYPLLWSREPPNPADSVGGFPRREEVRAEGKRTRRGESLSRRVVGLFR